MIKKWLIGQEQSARRSSFIWNAIAAGFNACQSAIVLIFVTRRLGLEMAGIVTIGYALANLFQTIGRYGLRNYQVTDINERFGFSDYFYTRIITSSVTLLAAIVYLCFCRFFGGYSTGKALIILEIVLLRMVDSFAEIYISRYQQKGRLDIGSKIHATELATSTVLICLAVLLGANLYIAFLIGILVAAGLNFILIHMSIYVVDGSIGKFQSSQVKDLLKTGLSLCIGLTLYMYIGNAPKYLLDFYMDEASQAIFGYVMMPMFVITLLNNFILQPIVKDLGDVWGEKDYPKFGRMILRHLLIIFGLCILVLIAGILIGLPLLSLFYGVSLTGYQMEFSILMFGGAFYTIAYYLTVILTTIRKQNMIIVGYVAAVIVYLALGKTMIQSLGMLGASWLYLIANAVTGVLFIIFSVYGIRKSEKLSDEK